MAFATGCRLVSHTSPESIGIPLLLLEVERVKTSRILGTSGRMFELFGFLAERSAQGVAPKEIEIDEAIFGRGPRTGSQEGIVRVYVHRLRRKLEAYYATKSGSAGPRLTLPKGEYRLVLDETASETGIKRLWTARIRRRVIAGALAILAAGNIVLASSLVLSHRSPVDAIQQSAVWKPLVTTKAPILVVVGDYYLFGDYSSSSDVQRLIRDFSINSKEDLLNYLIQHPDQSAEFGDVGLSYLPTSEATALAAILPILPHDRSISVLPSSAVTPAMLQNNDIIYLGLTSGLGRLQESTFRQSRLSIDNGYDDIVDNVTHTQYISHNPTGEMGDKQIGYGILSTYPGPTGNRITIIAGSRDAALASLSQSLSKMRSGDAIDRLLGKHRYYEALFKIDSQDKLVAPPHLILVEDRQVKNIWTDHG